MAIILCKQSIDCKHYYRDKTISKYTNVYFLAVTGHPLFPLFCPPKNSGLETTNHTLFLLEICQSPTRQKQTPPFLKENRHFYVTVFFAGYSLSYPNRKLEQDCDNGLCSRVMTDNCRPLFLSKREAFFTKSSAFKGH